MKVWAKARPVGIYFSICGQYIYITQQKKTPQFDQKIPEINCETHP